MGLWGRGRWIDVAGRREGLAEEEGEDMIRGRITTANVEWPGEEISMRWMYGICKMRCSVFVPKMPC